MFIYRRRPLVGKDWNEQLLGNSSYIPAKEDWSMFAAALNVDELKQQHIIRLVEQKVLSQAEREMLWQDWQAYRKRQNQLWQWYHQAWITDKSEAYLQRIVDIALAFNGTLTKN